MFTNKSKYGNNFLQYVTKKDGRVRYEHRILDDVIKADKDPFWEIYSPPNGWGCRCVLKKITGDDIKPTNTIGLNLHKSVPNIWRFNSAMEKTVFSKKHPYYKVSQKHKKLAKKNFNMPKPKVKLKYKTIKGVKVKK